MVLGAFAGMGAATVCHPLDVARVRMQTSPSSSATAWRTLAGAYRSDGLVRGLYAGLGAAYLRQWLYGSCRMGIYTFLLDRQGRPPNGSSPSTSAAFVVPLSTKLLLGGASGAVGSLAGTPSEVALVRMTADAGFPASRRRNYSGVFDCLSRIVKEEGGWTMLWRGATPTVARATLLGCGTLGVTSHVKSHLTVASTGAADEGGGWGGQLQSPQVAKQSWAGGLPVLFASTLCGSLVGSLLACPLDVAKSRLQSMPIERGLPPMYAGVADCLVKSVRSEGLPVLWRGLGPGFVKLAPYATISLTLLDNLTKAVTGKDAL